MKGSAKPFLRVFDELGVNVLDTSMTGSNHYKVTVEHNGAKKYFIMPHTTSDHRAILNFRSEVRRWIRGVLS